MSFSSKRKEKTFSWSLATQANFTRMSSGPNFTLSRSELLANQKHQKSLGICWAGATRWRIGVDEWRKESGYDEEIVITLNVEYIYEYVITRSIYTLNLEKLGDDGSSRPRSLKSCVTMCVLESDRLHSSTCMNV